MRVKNILFSRAEHNEGDDTYIVAIEYGKTYYCGDNIDDAEAVFLSLLRGLDK